jgi:hypothetical protein
MRDQLVDGISLKLKDFNVNYLQTIVKHALKNLRKIADGGVFATFKNIFLLFNGCSLKINNV